MSVYGEIAEKAVGGLMGAFNGLITAIVCLVILVSAASGVAVYFAGRTYGWW
jgi:hypothetical protein